VVELQMIEMQGTAIRIKNQNDMSC
jgi:hypothetical protein